MKGTSLGSTQEWVGPNFASTLKMTYISIDIVGKGEKRDNFIWDGHDTEFGLNLSATYNLEFTTYYFLLSHALQSISSCEYIQNLKVTSYNFENEI